MGCVLTCFRIRDDEKRKNRLISRLIPFHHKRSLASKQLPAPASECEDIGFLCDEDRNLRDADSTDKELLHEAKFLKGCGAILETPVEIQKGLEKAIPQILNEDTPSCNIYSWFPCTSSKKLLCNEQHDQLSVLEAQLDDGSRIDKTISAVYTMGVHEFRISEDFITANELINFTDGKKDSGVESELESATLDDSPHQAVTQIEEPGSNLSPYPTPLKLTDEMQTPLTVYPANLENPRARTNAKVHVYPILKPVDNLPLRKVLRENSCKFGQSDSPSEDVGKLPKLSPSLVHNGLVMLSSPNGNREGMSSTSVTPPSHNRENVFFSSENSNLGDSSLSYWLTHTPAADGNKWNCDPVTMGNSCSRQTPDGDRPSFGFVTAKWNDSRHCITPKLWDGNGIPNTTRKYKEDQKVTWHTTPFEERLEKVLTNDKLLPQRKLIEE